MQNKDIERVYLHEYIDVEKICKDMYGEGGVSAYINDMQNCTSREKRFIVNWDKKLKDLKHLRWLRNQITHENDSYEVTEQDLSDIKAFHNELLTQQDPLALLYKEIEKTKKKQQEYKLQQKTIQQMQPQSQPQEPNSDISLPMVLAFAAMLIAVALFVIYTLIK